jgi:nicotinamide-nucleotide adenylyltransferase
MIARWKPVHVGHSAILETLGERADRVVIGIGSSNKYDVANPFTAAESRAMIELVLARPGVEIVDVPDLGHGPRWRAMVVEMLGPLDAFVTANGYVKSLLEKDYRVLHPLELIPQERRVKASGTMVRRAIARGEPWRHLVPEAVARFLEERGLVERFRTEFGLATLALDVG